MLGEVKNGLFGPKSPLLTFFNFIIYLTINSFRFNNNVRCVQYTGEAQALQGFMRRSVQVQAQKPDLGQGGCQGKR